MKQDTVLVDVVRSVAPDRKRAASARPQISIAFSGGAVARLNPADPRERAWAEVLESLRASRAPAYIEFNPATGRISSLLLPRPHVVVSIGHAETDGDLEVQLQHSQAIHFLRRRGARFDELRDLLEEGHRTGRVVLVTDSVDGSAIVDVRPVEGAK